MAQAEDHQLDNAGRGKGSALLWRAAVLVLGVGCALLTGIQSGRADGPSGAPAILAPGGWGAALWEASNRFIGPSAGPLAFRCLAAIVLLAILGCLRSEQWQAGGVQGLRRLAFLSALAACALLPLGNDALLLPIAAGCALLPFAPAIALAWVAPFLTPLAFWASVAGVLVRWERGEGRKAALIAAAMIASPAGVLSIWNGSAFEPFARALLNDPWSGWTAGSLLAWSLPLWLAWLGFERSWSKGTLLAGRGGLSVLGLLARPLAGLGAVSSVQGDREKVSSPALLGLTGAAALALFAAQPPPQPPAAAREAMRSFAARDVVRVEPHWARALTRDIPEGCRLMPELRGWAAWRAWQAEQGKPASPPFADLPPSPATALLLSPRYPAFAARRPYAEAWRLESASRDVAVFRHDTGEAQAWDPYQPLPQEEAARRKAWGEALVLANKAPLFFEALRDAGRLSLDFGTGEDALAWLQAALKLHPKDAALMSDVGSAYHRLGKGKEAESFYLASIRENAQELLPRMNLAGLYIGAGQTENAEVVLKDLISKRPGFLAAHRMLIPLYLQAGRAAEAIAAAQAIPPDSRSPEEEALAQAHPPEEVKP